MIRRTNPHDERFRLIREAQDCFTTAAAALIEWPMEQDALALALFSALLGLHKLAGADHGHAAKDRVQSMIHARMKGPRR